MSHNDLLRYHFNDIKILSNLDNCYNLGTTYNKKKTNLKKSII